MASNNDSEHVEVSPTKVDLPLPPIAGDEISLEELEEVGGGSSGQTRAPGYFDLLLIERLKANGWAR